ncbi:MAG: MTH1187 family thiamine-binding protein [Deltaproteobacteria bacterium]|nr:MTH1187 family thiamine-binding protein [Deltaproteobacteria bacterium]
MSVLIHFSIFPTDKGTSVSPYVARALRIIRKSGLPYQLGPMSTAVEGEWAAVMAVVERCFGELQKDCDRIYMTLQMDYRKGAENRIEGKIKSVEEKLK